MNQQRHPIQMRFHLTRQQLLSAMNGSIGSATSYVSRTPNSIEYNVNVFPNGRSVAESGRFLVFLQFKFPETLTIFAHFNFTVGSTMQRSFQHSFKNSSSFGGILCPRQLLFYPTPMLINDRLLIELFGYVVIQRQPVISRPISVLPNLSQSSLNSPKPKENLSHRMPAPPLIVRKEKVVENAKSETELNVARILQNHLEEELKTPKTGEITHPPPKTEKSGADKDVEKTVTVDENVIPVAAEVTIEADKIEANVEHKTNVIEIPSDIHEPPSHSHETRPNSETTETDSHPNDSSSSTTTEEQPNRNKRVRSRTSRYVEFVVEEDEIVEEPVSKKSRKRKSILDQSPKNANLDDEYVPARRSKSGTRLPTGDEPSDPKINYDCKIEGVEKIFDVNKKMLAEKSKGFANLFEINSEDFIELEGIPDRTLEAAFNYCHGLPFKDNMNNREYFSLLFFAQTFEMPALKNVVEELLIEKIALTNACEIANTAIMAKAEKLKNECKKYIFENLRNNATLRNYVALNKAMKDEISAELTAKKFE